MITAGCSEHWGIIMSTLVDTKMHVGGYHEYTEGCSVHRRDTMSTPGA